jgi:hypothetical protein
MSVEMNLEGGQPLAKTHVHLGHTFGNRIPGDALGKQNVRRRACTAHHQVTTLWVLAHTPFSCVIAHHRVDLRSGLSVAPQLYLPSAVVSSALRRRIAMTSYTRESGKILIPQIFKL